MFDLVCGTLQTSTRLRLEADGKVSKAKVVESNLVDDGIELAVQLKAGRGRQPVIGALERIAASGEDATDRVLIGGRFNESKAKIGLVRAGYLVAFALFGYRYSLRSDIREIHAQFFERSAPTAFPLGMHLTGDRETRRIAIIDEPSWLASCLAIQLGRHIVVLPGDQPQSAFLERFKNQGRKQPELRLNGSKEWPWTDHPRFLND